MSAKTTNEAEAKRMAKDHTAKLRLNLAKVRNVSLHAKHHKPEVFLEFFISAKNIKSATADIYRVALQLFVKAVGEKALEHYTITDHYKFIQFLRNRNKTVLRGSGEEQKRHDTGKLSQNTIANYTRHLFSFFNFAVKNNVIAQNIIIKEKTEKREVRIIPDDHLEMIFTKLQETGSGKYYEPVKLKYLSGMRARELVYFHGKDVNYKNGILHIRNTKGTKKTVPLIKDLLAFLKTMKLEKDRQWPWMTYNSLKLAFHRACVSAGLEEYKYHLHLLRKTRGTKLALAGVPPLMLQEFLRHEDFETTSQYYTLIRNADVMNSINNLI